MENAQFGSLWSGLMAGRFHSKLPESPKQAVEPFAVELKACWDAWSAIETLKEVVTGLL